jgi:hypothetical protein
MDLHQLTQELPYQWKIQALRNGTATCVAYIDARDAMRLLDKVAGPENWQDKYYEACGQLFCTVSIKTDSGWVEKSDSGIVTADTAKVDLEMTQKGSASDAFKRACVKWGIGRFLYDLDVKRLPEAVFEANKYKLTDYINGLNGKAPAPAATVAKAAYKPDLAKAEYTGTHVCTKCKKEVVGPDIFDGKYGKCFKCPICNEYSKPNPKKDLTKEAGSIFNDPKADNPPF